MAGRASHHGVPCGLAVVDVESVDDDVSDVLDGDAGTAGDVNVSASAVNGLEAVHDELLLERDDHIPLEDDPERLILDDTIAEGALSRVDRVIVAGVGDNVDLAIAATNGIAAEADAAVSQALAVIVPVLIAAPAVVDGVACPARQVPEIPPGRAVPDGPVEQPFIQPKQQPFSFFHNKSVCRNGLLLQKEYTKHSAVQQFDDQTKAQNSD